MEETKVITQKSKFITICKDALLAIEILTEKFVCFQKHEKHIRWHHEHRCENGVPSHTSDGAVWNDFDNKYPNFASKPRTVRPGLCAKGFNPYTLSS